MKLTTRLLKKYYPTRGKKWCAQHFGVPETTVRARAAYYGIKIDHNSRFFKEWQARAALTKVGRKRPEQATVMKRLYAEGKLGVYTPARRRKMSRIARVWHSKHPHPKGMLGKIHTNEARRRMVEKGIGRKKSQASILKMMKTRAMRTYTPNLNSEGKRSWKAGRADDLGDVHFRSSWERNYARYLNFLVKRGEYRSWKFEAKTFWFEKVKRGTVSYKPDFEVVRMDGGIEYHEVKGWMDGKSATKLKRMAKYHPNVKVVLIDAGAYRSIAKYGKVYSPFWE